MIVLNVTFYRNSNVVSPVFPVLSVAVSRVYNELASLAPECGVHVALLAVFHAQKTLVRFCLYLVHAPDVGNRTFD